MKKTSTDLSYLTYGIKQLQLDKGCYVKNVRLPSYNRIGKRHQSAFHGMSQNKIYFNCWYHLY